MYSDTVHAKLVPIHNYYPFDHHCRVLIQELQAMVDTVGGPNNLRPDDPCNPYPGLTNFSLLSHGFGNHNISSALSVIQSYFNELIGVYEGNKSTAMNSQLSPSPTTMPGKKRRRRQGEESVEPHGIQLSSQQPSLSSDKEVKKEPKSRRQSQFHGGTDIHTNYWIIKSEPNQRLVKGVDVSYSLSQLMSEPGQTTSWDGVRNHDTKMKMLSMKVGDLAFFYHSSCRDPGFVGLVTVVKPSYPDPSQFDLTSPYYDPDSSTEEPRWFSVDIKFVRRLQRPILLSELKKYQKEHLLNNGPLIDLAIIFHHRLSVLPMSKDEYNFVVENLEPKKYESTK